METSASMPEAGPGTNGSGSATPTAGAEPHSQVLGGTVPDGVPNRSLGAGAPHPQAHEPSRQVLEVVCGVPLPLAMHDLLSAIEHTLVQRALDATHGNKKEAADLLGIRRTTLVEKLRRWRPTHPTNAAGDLG